MTRTSLKRKIDLKFGSWHNFARIVGVHTLRGKTPLEIDRMADALSRTVVGGGIPREKLDALKSKIMTCGGVTAFCLENKDFSETSLFQILQGRRKRMSPVVNRLFQHFGL